MAEQITVLWRSTGWAGDDPFRCADCGSVFIDSGHACHMGRPEHRRCYACGRDLHAETWREMVDRTGFPCGHCDEMSELLDRAAR